MQMDFEHELASIYTYKYMQLEHEVQLNLKHAEYD